MKEIIFGENLDGDNIDKIKKIKKKRFDFLCKRIKEIEKYENI